MAKKNKAHRKHDAQAQHEGVRLNPYFEKFTTNGFLPNQDANFDDEFDRLAEQMKWLQLGNAYQKHRSLALEQQGEILQPRTDVTAPGPPTLDNSFFARFVPEGFTRNTNASFKEEFNQLGRHMGWSHAELRDNRALAATQEIEVYYGSSVKLQGWQQLCEDVGITPIPTSVKTCKKVRGPRRRLYIASLTVIGTGQALYQPLRPY